MDDLCARAYSPPTKCVRLFSPKILASAGVLLGLGLLTFFMHGSPESMDTRQTTHAVRGDLRPLVGAKIKPSGGGMVEREEHPGGSDAAAAAMRARTSAETSKPAAAAAASGGASASAHSAANATAAVTNATLRRR